MNEFTSQKLIFEFFFEIFDQSFENYLIVGEYQIEYLQILMKLLDLLLRLQKKDE
jgi:hypothetical protein